MKPFFKRKKINAEKLNEMAPKKVMSMTYYTFLLNVMVMNLYSAFCIGIFKCALQASDLWVRPDISIYRHRWQLNKLTVVQSQLRDL